MLNLHLQNCMELMKGYADNHFDLTACELDADYFADMRKRLDFHARQSDMFQKAQLIKYTAP